MFPFQCCAVNTIRFSSYCPRPLDLLSGERVSRSLTDALSHHNYFSLSFELAFIQNIRTLFKMPQNNNCCLLKSVTGPLFLIGIYIHPYIMYILYIYRFFRVALREGTVMVANISIPTPLVVQKQSIIMSTLLPHLRIRLLQEKHVDRLKESREYWRFCLKIPVFV